MKSLDCRWADRYSLIKFFKDAPGMDICERLNYFNDLFPYAELLPSSLYLIDSKNTHVACNQITLSMLGDKHLTEFLGFSSYEYISRKGWPQKLGEIWSANNHAALQRGQTIVCQESSLYGNSEKKWISRKEPIYDDNGLPVGILGIIMPIRYDNQSIYCDADTKKIVILFSVNNLVEFSMREFCVLKGMLNGSTAEEIAREENISHKTVETYMMRIKLKLNCHKLRDVISLCIKNDLAKTILEFQYDFIKH